MLVSSLKHSSCRPIDCSCPERVRWSLIERERKRGSFSTYKFDQQKSLPRMMMTTTTTATWFARLLSSLSSSLPCAPSDGPCRKKRPLSEPEISEIWEHGTVDGNRNAKLENPEVVGGLLVMLLLLFKSMLADLKSRTIVLCGTKP